jgi:SPX domain protein involved in polyphosphate accumulation
MLQNYRILNYTGLVKIISKYDIHCNTQHSNNIIKRLEQEPFYANALLTEMTKETESVFIKYIHHGNRKKAMEQVVVVSIGI